MHPNGVSHLEVGNDQEGVDRILQWLSYVPKTAGSQPVARPITDPVDREVTRLWYCGPYTTRSRGDETVSVSISGVPASKMCNLGAGASIGLPAGSQCVLGLGGFCSFNAVGFRVHPQRSPDIDLYFVQCIRSPACLCCCINRVVLVSGVSSVLNRHFCEHPRPPVFRFSRWPCTRPSPHMTRGTCAAER